MKNLLHILVLLLSSLAQGQDIYFEKIEKNMGLGTNHVYDVYRDTKGFLWVTTDRGLYRFNGQKFKLMEGGQQFSKSGTYIKEDDKERIWYQSFDGYFFYTQQDHLQILPTQDHFGFKPYFIKNDFLYRITDAGIERIDLNSFKTELIIKQPDLLFCFDHGDTMVYGNQTVFKWHYNHQNPIEICKIEKKLASFIAFSDGDRLIISDRSLPFAPFYIIDKNGVSDELTLPLPEPIQNLYFLENEIRCFTRNGIYRFDKTLHPLPHHHLMNHTNVSSFTEDPAGVTWVGSPTEGIFLIKDWESKAYTIEQDAFSAFSYQDNTLFAGTEKGKIWQFDTDLNAHIYFDTHENHPILYMNFNLFDDYHFFSANGFFSRNIRTNKMNRSPFAVKEIIQMDSNRLGIAATGVVASTQLDEVMNPKFSEVLMQSIRAKNMAYDAGTRRVYISSNKGLTMISKNGEENEITYKGQAIFPTEIEFVNDTLMGVTPDGKLFHYANGILKLENNTEKINRVKVFNQHFYFNCNRSVYTYKQGKIQKLNGLSNYSGILDFIILDRYAYILTTQKIIRLPLTSLRDKNTSPKIFINELTFNQEKIDWKKPSKHSYKNNSLTISFDVVDFNFLNDYTYAYQLNDQFYTFDRKIDYITLPNLNTGNYSFRFVISEKNTNKILFQSQPISFEIMPPIWKRFWFILIINLVLALLSFFVYSWYVRKIKKENILIMEKLTVENKLKDSRLQLIKSQMNPHFFFNAINSIQSYIFTNDTKEASQYLYKFSKLTRKILEFSNATQVNLQEEIESLRLYLDLQQMRFKDLFYEITTELNQQPEEIKIPTMLIQPYVENAILHGLSHSIKSKNLIINFKQSSDNTLNIKIQDNGVGRKKSEQINQSHFSKPKSFATKANLERIMWLNKDQYNIQVNYTDLIDENLESCGTLVEITITL